eukprot:352860-Amphidinium_carterae.1
MEELVAAGEFPLEQLQVVGYAMMLIHARCRYSDAIRPGWIPLLTAKVMWKPLHESPRRLKRRCTRTQRCAS